MIADKIELLRVLDDDGKETGEIRFRDEVHIKSLFHNEITLWVINKKDKKILLQKRSEFKKIDPNKYAPCMGHVVENETIMETLFKEAQEELGIDLSKYKIVPLVVVKNSFPNNHHFSHHFYIVASIPISEIIIQKEELSEVLYMGFEKLKKLVVSNSPMIVFRNTGSDKIVLDALEDVIKSLK